MTHVFWAALLLGAFGYLFGTRALAVLVLGGPVLVVGFIVLDTYREASLREVDLRPPPADLSGMHACSQQEAAKEDPWAAVGGKLIGADTFMCKNKPTRPLAAAPAPVAAPATPEVVSTAPSSPAQAWELLPWPPGSSENGTPSAAAQGLLDRLNAAQGIR